MAPWLRSAVPQLLRAPSPASEGISGPQLLTIGGHLSLVSAALSFLLAVVAVTQ
jgi:hypothetical protein